MTCKRYCEKVTITIGPAKKPNLLSSSLKLAHVRDGVTDFLLSSLISFGNNKLSSISFYVSLMKVLSALSCFSLAQTLNMKERDREKENSFELLVCHGLYIMRNYYALSMDVLKKGDRKKTNFLYKVKTLSMDVLKKGD